MKVKTTAKFKVGDKVETFRREIGTITKVVVSIAYEIDHYHALYQPDEIRRRVKRVRK